MSLLIIFICLLLCYYYSSIIENFEQMSIIDDQIVPWYYINMDKSVSRGEKLLNEFRKYNLKHVFRIKAVEPPDLSHWNIQISSNCSKKNSLVEIACSISHLKAIFTAYKNNDRFAVICEDDIFFLRQPNIAKIIKTAQQQIPDFSIIQLYSIGPIAEKIYQFEKIPFIPYVHGLWSTAAYLISRKGMENILDTFIGNEYKQIEKFSSVSSFNLNPPIHCAADYLIYSLDGTFTFTDFILATLPIPSTIQESSHEVIQNRTRKLIFEIIKTKGFKNNW